uniref:Uncharacterized protein n=1 Tax=Rhizophora mucronata TaxID=61149 RepID=A0A2P2MIH3_RHIMU
MARFGKYAEMLRNLCPERPALTQAAAADTEAELGFWGGKRRRGGVGYKGS